ncbi:MAG: carbohydrate kinase [Planctomycetaceae bacterium]|nr:carbohydrate kinase [Planctomycetaceae bacterium]
MYKIASLGEVLWDMLPTGKKVGGAPGNFAYHCRKFGADAVMISRVGDDLSGHELLAFYRSCGLPTGLISIDPYHQTGAVDVTFSQNGCMEYCFREDVAWDHFTADEKSLALIRESDVICFGTLAGRTRKSARELQKLILAASPKTVRLFDVNLRAPHYEKATILELLGLTGILKLNDEELPVLCRMPGCTETDGEIQAAWLREKYQLPLLILTCGKKGSLLVTKHEASRYQSVPVTVADTVGAGDAFTAAALTGFLRGEPLDRIHRSASKLAAFVCTQQGAMPDYDEKWNTI